MLVVNQILGEYQAKEDNMISYLKKAKVALEPFKHFTITQIPRDSNSVADALARIASSLDLDTPESIPIWFIETPSISPIKQAMNVTESDSWMTPIIQYLRDETLPDDKVEARTLRTRSACYTLIGDQLYRRRFSAPLLRCVTSEEVDYIMREIHKGICGNYTAARSLANKVVRQGYYWLLIQEDIYNFVKRCDKCQRFTNIL